MDDPRLLPDGYRLDGADADVLMLRREDGSPVAVFSAWGATREGIRRAAVEDRASGDRLAGRRVIA